MRVRCASARRLLVNGETKPCGLMERTLAGLEEALRPEWRGGVYVEVIDGGEIAVGDAILWESDETRS